MAEELVPTSAAVEVLDRRSAFVSPAAPTHDILLAQQGYQELCSSLLDESDYQTIGKRKFRKKSAWRKLSLAFNVSTEIILKEYERNDAGRIVRAEVTARATAPNGRYADGLGACDLFERCCLPGCTKSHGNAGHCPGKDGQPCDGGRHFSNPQHDIPATAATRATNRAASDLFGMGEVSAEEMNTHRLTVDDVTAEKFNAHVLMQPYLGRLSSDQKRELGEWRQKEGLPPSTEMSPDQAAAALVQIGRLLAAAVQQPERVAAEVVQRDEEPPFGPGDMTVEQPIGSKEGQTVHKRVGAILAGTDNIPADFHDELVYFASKGRTTHTSDLTRSEADLVVSIAESVADGSNTVDGIAAANEQWAQSLGPDGEVS